MGARCCWFDSSHPDDHGGVREQENPADCGSVFDGGSTRTPPQATRRPVCPTPSAAEQAEEPGRWWREGRPCTRHSGDGPHPQGDPTGANGSRYRVPQVPLSLPKVGAGTPKAKRRGSIPRRDAESLVMRLGSQAACLAVETGSIPVRGAMEDESLRERARLLTGAVLRH